jgi:ornithine carbamoyltransferase
MPKRDFLAVSDFTAAELGRVLDLADRMKRGEYTERPLAGMALAMIFGKSSTRTRVAFEVGAYQLGGHALFLSSQELQLGRGEPTRDTARVLSGYVDGIMVRTCGHGDVEELARYATVPVINGRSDLLHPCRILADMLTVREEFGDLEGRVVAWVGDGNNVANTWIDAAGALGFELRLACPEGYEPSHTLFEQSAARTRVTMTELPEEAVAGAHVVTTDVWASLGHEEESEARRTAFQGYVVDPNLMALAHPGAIFLHGLPAHRGEEVSDAVLEGPQSRVWVEARNRLHIQKALLATLLGGKTGGRR